MKVNVDCPKKDCEFYGGYGALGSADPLNQGTCLRGDGSCVKGKTGIYLGHTIKEKKAKS